MTAGKIFTRRMSGGPQTEHESAEVLAGTGIKGDWHFNRKEESGQKITLIEAEEIEFVTSEYQRTPDLSISSRNIVTRGVRLNDLIGRDFVIDEIRLRGVEICEPCLGLGKALVSPELPAANVVKRFLHLAGLGA